jgi:hypothetical protein
MDATPLDSGGASKEQLGTPRIFLTGKLAKYYVSYSTSEAATRQGLEDSFVRLRER